MKSVLQDVDLTYKYADDSIVSLSTKNNLNSGLEEAGNYTFR